MLLRDRTRQKDLEWFQRRALVSTVYSRRYHYTVTEQVVTYTHTHTDHAFIYTSTPMLYLHWFVILSDLFLKPQYVLLYAFVCAC